MSDAEDEFPELLRELDEELVKLVRPYCDAEAPLHRVNPEHLAQVDRRIFVRSAFAAIDAIAYNLKQRALQSLSILSDAERALCVEESYELADNGTVEERPARLRFLPNLRFAFRVAAKANNTALQLDVSGPGWQAVQKGSRVRDRLMHPKRIVDLTVTDEEIRVGHSAYLWIAEQLVNWLVTGNEIYKQGIRSQRIELEHKQKQAESLQRELAKLQKEVDKMVKEMRRDLAEARTSKANRRRRNATKNSPS